MKREMYGKEGQAREGCAREAGSPGGYGGQPGHAYTWGCRGGGSQGGKLAIRCPSREQREGHRARWFTYPVSLALPSK